jgi:hypothetical protein
MADGKREMSQIIANLTRSRSMVQGPLYWLVLLVLLTLESMDVPLWRVQRLSER